MDLISVLTDICDYPSQPRSRLDPEYCLGLGQNMKTNGQKVPGIGWFRNGRFQLADGGCRLEGAKIAGISELLVLDLGKEPSRSELLLAQASIDMHKQHLPPVNRARFFQSIMTETGQTAKQTAQSVGISASLLSRYMPLLDLVADLQELVNAGTLKWTKGTLIAQATKDPDGQREMAKAAAGLTRDALATAVRKVRNSNGEAGKPSVHVSRMQCPLPSGVTITITGRELSLDDAIDATGTLLRELKKAHQENFDCKTFGAVCVQKAKNEGKADGNDHHEGRAIGSI